MRLARVWLLNSLLVILIAGCAIPQPWRRRSPKSSADAEAVAKARRPLQRVGVVRLVNETDGFVLIDSGPYAPPGVGARLLSYSGPDASGQLRASQVRRRPFIVADIVEGTPRTGDEVFEAATAVAVAVKP